MRQGRTSRTALAVAAYFVFVSREERFAGLCPPGAGEATARLLEPVMPRLFRWNMRLLRRRWVRAWTWRNERLWMPGSILHLGVRKRYFEDQVRDALAEGCRQVVVLGAGFDALCPRLAGEEPGVHFFELDHPATHAAKRRAVDAAGLARDNLHLIPADLGRSGLDQALRSEPAYRPDRTAAFTAEGLLMYLEPAAVEEMLAAVRRSAAPGSRLVFSCMQPGPDGAPTFGRWDRLMRLRLRMAGEPLRWGVAAGELARFLETAGFRLQEAPGVAELRRRYLPGLDGEPLMGFERLAVATTAPVPP